MLVALITVPLYLHLIGDTRYGVLSIVWLFLGYFGLFDPGLSRAATYHIARLHNAPAKDRGDVFWTALVVNIGFGIIGGIAFYLISKKLFLYAFKIPSSMRGEVLQCLPWLAASVPVSIVTGVLSSVLQAREWFGVSNSINVLNTVLTQVTPLGIAYFHGPDLLWLIPSILVARAAGAVPSFFAVSQSLPLGAGGKFRTSLLGSMFSYGGWITVSNFIAPLLASMDRLLIGSVVSAAAVTLYAVPFNLVTRVSVIPGALANSVFPKLSRGNAFDRRRLAGDSIINLAAVMTPIIALVIIILPIFMRFWVGADFASHAGFLGKIFLLGVWINGLAYIPYNLLQASNRPDITAKFHAAELLPFLGMLWFGIHYFGLPGAAWAWTLRVTVDGVLLFAVTKQILVVFRVIPGILFLLVAIILSPNSLISIQTGLALTLLLIILAWSWTLSAQIRTLIITKFRSFAVSTGR